MVIKFRHPAPWGTLFSTEAAQSLIGQTFVAKTEDTVIGEGKVIDADIVDLGTAVDLTIEWPENIEQLESWKG